MDAVLRVTPSILAVFFLTITLYLANLRLDPKDSFRKLYLVECIYIIAMLLLEAGTCLINGCTNRCLHVVMQGAHVILFLSPPLLTYSCFLFVQARTECKEIGAVSMRAAHWIPIAINAMLVIFSTFYGWVFSIDAQGIYHRGPLFVVSVGIAYFYLLCGLGFMILRRRMLLKSEIRFLALCCMLPIFGGMLQVLIYGPLVVWPSTACTMVLIYLYHREQLPELDSLTGTCTRGAFERYMERVLLNDDREPFGVVYLDLNGLKAINDAYGHAIGDDAIRDFAGILCAQLRAGDMIGRLGGDEFAILANVRMPAEVNALVQRIRMALFAHNQSAGKPYKLSCSIGADLFMRSGGRNVQSILQRVDLLMYEDKRSKYARSSNG